MNTTDKSLRQDTGAEIRYAGIDKNVLSRLLCLYKELLVECENCQTHTTILFVKYATSIN